MLTGVERPSPSICDILPSCAALLGVPDVRDELRLATTIGDARRIVVVLVDGLGWHLLPTLAPSAPLLASVVSGTTGQLDELSCTFPSTTPTSLVSLGTGVPPGQHGVLGFTVRIPGSEQVLVHIRWGDTPDPRRWQPVPTCFERLAAAGVESRVLLPASFQGSGLTEAAYRGARFCGTSRGEDYAPRLLAELTQMSTGLAYGYTAELDTAAHQFGIGSPQWHLAAAHVDTLLSRLVENLPSDAALLVTGDHGGLNVPLEGRIDLDTDPRLSAGISLVAGEARMRHLHTLEGATHDVLATWREVLGPQAEVHSRDEAVQAGLFGPVRAQHLDRIGDVIVSCNGQTVILAGAHEPPEAAKLVGYHGAATRAELAIPLIAVRG